MKPQEAVALALAAAGGWGAAGAYYYELGVVASSAIGVIAISAAFALHELGRHGGSGGSPGSPTDQEWHPATEAVVGGDES